MFLLLYFILRRVVAYHTVIVAMRCLIISTNHYLSICWAQKTPSTAQNPQLTVSTQRVLTNLQNYIISNFSTL